MRRKPIQDDRSLIVRTLMRVIVKINWQIVIMAIVTGWFAWRQNRVEVKQDVTLAKQDSSEVRRDSIVLKQDSAQLRMTAWRHRNDSINAKMFIMLDSISREVAHIYQEDIRHDSLLQLSSQYKKTKNER